MKKMNINIALSLIAMMAVTLFVTPSCQRYDDPPPYFEEQGDTTKPVARKLLLIAIDGAVGSEYKAIAPAVLMGMKAHSKYSWDALSDASTTDGASWKTLMTGVSYYNHQIEDSSFLYAPQPWGNQHGSITNYPSIFSYILSSARADLHTSVISQWNTLLNRVVPEAEEKVLASNDAAVKDSAILRVKNERTDVIVVNFNSVAVAGKEHGFSASADGYKNAVSKVDGYIGEVMTALKSRAGYNKTEEWLVIIAGTHGGSGNSYGGPSAKEANVISFFYNENMKETEFLKPAFTGVQLKGRDGATIKAQIVNDGGLYNAGTGEQTIQLKIKGPNPGSWPHFFTRMAGWPSTPGWSYFASGTNWAFSVRSTTGTERRLETPTLPVFDNQWHTLTVVIYDSVINDASGVPVKYKWVKRFTDGNRIIENASNEPKRNLGANYGSIESTSPMMLGWGGDKGFGAVTFHAADVMIFNKALTDEEVKNNICLQDLTQHPKYANLIGYWPFNDGGFSRTVKNMAPGNKPDFTIEGSFQWEGTDVPCTTPKPASGVAFKAMKSVDIAPNVFYWLRIHTNTNWRLEGSKWLEEYETEFVKM